MNTGQIVKSRSTNRNNMIHQELKRIRKEANLTQSELGELLGCTKQYISQTEKGIGRISDQKAELWANYCGYKMQVKKVFYK